MLLCVERRGDLKEVKVCRDAIPVSHLLFANNSLILMTADRKNALTLKHILDTYYLSSGQMVSDPKCNIFSVQILR